MSYFAPFIVNNKLTSSIAIVCFSRFYHVSRCIGIWLTICTSCWSHLHHSFLLHHLMATGCFLKILFQIRMHNSSGPHGSMGFCGVEGGAGRSALRCNMISVFPTRGLRSSSTGTITTYSASRYGHRHIFIHPHQDKFCPHRITDRWTKNWSITYDRFWIKYLNIEHFCHCFEVVILKLLLRGTDAALGDRRPLRGDRRPPC